MHALALTIPSFPYRQRALLQMIMRADSGTTRRAHIGIY